MKFEDYRFCPEIKQNLNTLGFMRPTDIQYKAIPPVLRGEDVLAIAQTGTGKTAAFAIPVVQLLQGELRKEGHVGVKCLVMVPTHELALQIREVFDAIAKDTGVRAFCIYGGVDQEPQIQTLKRGPEILIATPGRMFDLESQGYLNLEGVKILILDEADHMLDMGFIKDIRHLIQKLPKQRQTLFFSATINEYIKKIAYSLVINAIRIQISPKDPVAKNIEHYVAYVEMDDKRFFLERLINENPEKKILVFVRTKVRAERVLKALARVEIHSITIHGDKTQAERNSVMKRFGSGEVKVLIATDVSARGVDIPNVEYVVNYDLPDQSENYVHRVGRTGRGIHKGKAISFCSEEEKKVLEDIESFLGNPIDLIVFEQTEYQQTIEFSNEPKSDWRSLIAEAEMNEAASRKTKKTVKKKK
jgi:ATP-dependent RNA helicase RhlE